MTRVFAISDLHTDYKPNLEWIFNLSDVEYQHDYLICAGDISHNLKIFSATLQSLASKFSKVFFVPGNHDLWIRDKDAQDSIEKFKILSDICSDLGIETKPTIIQNGDKSIVIYPLLSWYVKPEEGRDSLYRKKERDDPTLSMWVDNREIKWPDNLKPLRAIDYFLDINQQAYNESFKNYRIITFSHFLPRQDLIFSKMFSSKRLKFVDPFPQFNFTRVAGSTKLEKQIRKFNSNIHIYGHLHRNRFRYINDILYVAHVFGNPKERKMAGINDHDYLPKLIWSPEKGVNISNEN